VSRRKGLKSRPSAGNSRQSGSWWKTRGPDARFIVEKEPQGFDMPTKLPSFSRDRAYRNEPRSGLLKAR